MLTSYKREGKAARQSPSGLASRGQLPTWWGGFFGRQSRPQKASSRSGEVAEFTRPEGLLRFAAAVGRGGVKTPPYGAKDKRAVPARWRAGHARPLRTAPNRVPTRGAREGGSPPSFPLTGCRGRLRAAYMPPLQSCRSPLRGFGGTPEFKVEEGAGALRTDSNTASV